jgi:CBS domain containing-hemolysin-like protein
MIWFLLPICLALAFILSGMESALLTCSRVRARHAADEGDKLAARLAALLEKRNEILHTVTVLNRAMGLGAFTMVAVALVHLLGPWGWAAALLLALPVFLIGLELVPKILFRRYPFRLLRSFAPLLSFIHRASAPTLWLARIITPKQLISPSHVNAVGLSSVAKSVASLGVLPEQTCKLLHGLADFHPLQARNVMTHLKQVSALPPDLPLAGVIAMSKEVPLPWRAVMTTDGTLRGWLDMTALPAAPSRDRLVRQFMRPLLQLRETDAALRCLQALRKRGEPVAAVLNEKGETVGLVTQKGLVQALLAQNGKNGNGHK